MTEKTVKINMSFLFHGVLPTKKQRQRFALQELLKYNVFATVPPL